MTRITGIDLSFRHCGVATIEYDRSDDGVSLTVQRQEIVETEFIGKDWHSLLKEMVQMRGMIRKLAELVADADEVLVEIATMQGKPNQSSVRTAGICYGIISGAQVISGKLFRYIHPETLKEWSGHKRNKKEHVSKKVFEKLGRTVLTRDNNIIDALGLCLLRCDEISYAYQIQRHNTLGTTAHSESQHIPSGGNDCPPSVIQLPLQLMQSDCKGSGG
jgi:Holliday junction resolvasome RuvABC endonuclease subunit